MLYRCWQPRLLAGAQAGNPLDTQSAAPQGNDMTKTLKLHRPDGTLIERWEDWTRPKMDCHWKAGRSAMEFAKAWFREETLSVPVEVLSLLESDRRLQGVKLISGIPEHVTRLPERGEGRNHDLALLGKTIDGNVTICVEAKADEAFGNESVFQYWHRAICRRTSGASTRVPERIQSLLEMVGPTGVLPEESPWSEVRYQLLTAICGTALQAKRDSSSLAVFVVHEFHTDLTLKENLMRNHHDFERLLQALSSDPILAESNRLYGPFQICGIDCLIGKVVAA